VAIVVPSPASIALRFGGSFIFVVLTSFVVAYLVPDRFEVESIPRIVILILVGCAHLYLLYRAYYPLRISGFIVFSVIYALMAYYVMASFGVEIGVSSMPWMFIVYLTLLYGFGLSYNHIDAALSGLLHTKGV